MKKLVIEAGQAPVEVDLSVEEMADLLARQSTPERSVPGEITNFQARALLMQLPSPTPGKTMFDLVDEALREQGGVAWQAWEYANTITRHGVLVQGMAAQLGFSAEMLDDLFSQASAISA